MNRNLSKLAVPVGVVGIIMLLIVPIPAPLLDVLIIINILLALVTLLTTMFVQKPLDFSVFPSLLLVATLFRLGLNVASTRLVLGEAHAGAVINAFGKVAVSGSLIIGVVIFLILVVIQFVVVTKGAERVAEVGARFTLDAMPGKQMAIDADLNAGLITDIQAKERRAEVSAEADFYGAMDGSSKFVKGDAIAGIVIIVINMVGGLGIGMLQRGLSLTDALSTYSILTIGDGLVTQIPALLMAVSTGMIVTRSNASSDLGSTASKQLSQSRTALMIAGVAAFAMALIPGMPAVPFILIGLTLIIISRRIKGTEAKAAIDAADPDGIRGDRKFHRVAGADRRDHKAQVHGDFVPEGLHPAQQVIGGVRDDLDQVRCELDFERVDAHLLDEFLGLVPGRRESGFQSRGRG
jgi:flagellar biosynthesis protein FlhA